MERSECCMYGCMPALPACTCSILYHVSLPHVLCIRRESLFFPSEPTMPSSNGGSSPLFSVHETGASGLVCPCGVAFFPGLSRGLGHLDFGLARGADRYSSVVKGRVEDWASFGRWAYLHASGRCLCSSSTGNWVVRRGGRDGRDGSGRE